MAKGARSSTKKANHAALKSKVFGPVENARAERLHAKLMELATQPKESKVEDVDMEVKESNKDVAEVSTANISEDATPIVEEKESEEMEVDKVTLKSTIKSTSKASSKGRISKRSSRRKTMTFTTYKKGKKVGGRN